MFYVVYYEGYLTWALAHCMAIVASRQGDVGRCISVTQYSVIVKETNGKPHLKQTNCFFRLLFVEL